MDISKLDIHDQYEIYVNMRRFFSEYYPGVDIPSEPYEFFATGEDEDDDTPSFGWDNLPEIRIMLGHVQYRAIGQVYIEIDYTKDKVDIGKPQIWMVNAEAYTESRGSLEYVNVNMLTKGWVNKYCKTSDFYEGELKTINNLNL